MEHVAQTLVEQMYSFDFGGAFNSKVLGNLAHANQKKVFGFQINGIGNGHLTQAKTVYDILIEHYAIPVVLVYGRSDTNGVRFDASEVAYLPYASTPESTNDGDVLAIAADFISIKPTRTYEEAHQVNFWMNFFVADLGNFRTAQLVIANQFSTSKLKVLAPLYCAQYAGVGRFVSVAKPSMLTPNVLPPLIDTNALLWKPEPKRILCYSVSGEAFPRTLRRIARRHPGYRFDYFLNYAHSSRVPSNVRVHPTSKGSFKEHQEKAAAVLCTSGHELIQECVFMGLPVASMACDEAQEEQVDNCEYYTTKGWCRAMTDELDLADLVKSDVTSSQAEMASLVEGSEAKILKLIEEC